MVAFSTISAPTFTHLYGEASDLLQIVAVQVCYYATMLALIGGAGFQQQSEAELFLLAMTARGSIRDAGCFLFFWPDRYTSAGGTTPE